MDFTRTYYEHYLDDFRGTFDGAAYTVKDDWAHYDKIAAVLTRRFMRTKGHPDDRGEGAGERNRGRKRWWQVWR